jgi:uncharacterized protein YkuJ
MSESPVLEPNFKDLMTLRCLNNKDANLSFSGYKGYLHLSIFDNKKKIFQQVVNRRLAKHFILGLEKTLSIAPGEKAGVIVFNNFNRTEGERKGEWVPVCHVKFSKNDNGQIMLSFKLKVLESEYQFVFQSTAVITSDWIETEADKSKLEAELLIGLFKDFSSYDSVIRLNRPSTFSPKNASNSDNPF